jgi:hypothetical protein
MTMIKMILTSQIKSYSYKQISKVLYKKTQQAFILETNKFQNRKCFNLISFSYGNRFLQFSLQILFMDVLGVILYYTHKITPKTSINKICKLNCRNRFPFHIRIRSNPQLRLFFQKSKIYPN